MSESSPTPSPLNQFSWRIARRRRSRVPLRRRAYLPPFQEEPSTSETAYSPRVDTGNPELEKEHQELKTKYLQLINTVKKLEEKHRQDIEYLKSQNIKLDKMVGDAREIVTKNKADMENLRKRTRREVENVKEFAAESIISKLLSVMDHFNLALHSMESAEEVSSVIQGVSMIKKELENILEAEGLSPIEALNQPFDPNVHDAVSTTENPDQEDGTIIDVLRSGWKLKTKVIRPSMVVVNKLPDEKQTTPPPDNDSEE